MDKMPKLKVNGLGWSNSPELVDFEQARYFPYCNDLIITVEDQVINSYNDLVQLASAGTYKDKEYLEVVFLPMIVGG
jgi:hypothetical protein